MYLAALEFGQLEERAVCDFVFGGRNRQRDQRLVRMQAGIDSAQLELEPLNRLNGGGRDQIDRVLDSAEHLEGVEQQGRGCTQQVRGASSDNGSVRKLHRSGRSAGQRCLLQGRRNHLAVVDGYARFFHQQLQLVDYLRIDHFRGFEAYWSVPADEKTAINGKWKKGPGKKLFQAIQKELGEDLPIWAEDLGVITPEVEELRDGFAFPGMKILQFAFEGLDESDYHPHNLTTTNCICYTGTHDNDTTTGWYQNLPEPQKDKIRRYCNCDGGIISLDFIRMCMGSIAKYAIFPIQDLFMQDSSCRMNIPGSAFANWAYRYEASALTQDRANWLKSTTELFGRGRSKSL